MIYILALKFISWAKNYFFAPKKETPFTCYNPIVYKNLEEFTNNFSKDFDINKTQPQDFQVDIDLKPLETNSLPLRAELTWQEKRECLKFIQGHKTFRWVAKTIPSPYDLVIGKLINFISMQEFLIKQPDFGVDETSTFYQKSRDMKVAFGKFDRIILKSVVQKINAGQLEFNEGAIKKYLDEFYSTELNNYEFQNWVNESLLLINNAATQMATYIKTSETYGPFIQSFLINVMNPPSSREPPSLDEEGL